MKLRELMRITKRMEELGIDPETTTVEDIWYMVASFRKNKVRAC